MERRARICLAIIAVAALAMPGTAHAAGPVVITFIAFDSPGKDTRTNASLNAEYVVIKNTGTTARALTGWTLRDEARHVYRFGTLKLGPGKTVTVHTGRGTNRPAHRYWGSGNYIWNNTGDKATLRNAKGAVVDTCTYSGRGDTVRC